MNHLVIANMLMEHIPSLTQPDQILAAAQAHALIAAAEALQHKDMPIQVWVCVQYDDDQTHRIMGVVSNQDTALQWRDTDGENRHLIPCTLGKIHGG